MAERLAGQVAWIRQNELWNSPPGDAAQDRGLVAFGEGMEKGEEVRWRRHNRQIGRDRCNDVGQKSRRPLNWVSTPGLVRS